MERFNLTNFFKNKSKYPKYNSDLNRVTALAEGQSLVLEMLSQGAPLKEVFTCMIKVFESYYEDMMGSVMLIEEENNCLRAIAAPSLPHNYVMNIDGLKVGPKSGGCGTAAFRRERVFISDLLNDPLCEGFTEVILQNGLQSCWSQPFFSLDGNVLGVFSMMSKAKRKPTPEESQFIDSAARLVSLAVEKKLSEEALIDSEEKFRSVFETAGTPVILTDKDLTIIEWNRAAEKIFGYKREEVLGTQGIYYMVPSKHHSTVKSETKKILKDGVISNMEIDIITKKGEKKVLLWNASKVRTSNGKSIGLIGVGQEITERKKAEKELILAKKMAEAASEAKSNFVANMNHELRTPLAAISGLTNLLNDTFSKNEIAQELTAKIKSNVGHLLSIVDDLLDLSKVESGYFNIEKKQLFLKNFMEETMSPLRETAEAKNLSLVVNYSLDLPGKIFSDPVRLRQILNNLIGNAIKFTDKGKITIEVLPKYEINEIISGLIIKIQDEGCGIHPDFQEEVFKPFVQADSSMSRTYEGTGLGLSISERLSKALGGEIYLEKSSPGKGSTFVAEINTETNSGENISVHSINNTEKKGSNKIKTHIKALDDSDEEEYFGDFKVLLAEDHPDLRIITERQLKKQGASVDIVENGQLAVESALKNKYDVILMDIQMPVMDGYKAVKELRENGYTRPIIALTARSLKDEVDQYKERGFNQYLTKPLSNSMLNQALKPYMVQ